MKMRRESLLVVLIGTPLVIPGVALAQAAPKLEFEVASIRPSGPQSTGPNGARQWKNGGAGSNDAGTLTYTLMPLRVLLMDAYGVKPDQFAGPAVLDERYDVAAKVPAGTTEPEQNMMLRNLLIERFHLSVHEEVQEIPGYALTIAKGGAKLKESLVDPADKPLKLAECRPTPDRDGAPQLPAGCRGPVNVHQRDTGKAYIIARQQSIARLIQSLPVFVNIVAADRIADKTGLTGTYDFRVGFSEAGLSAKAGADQDPAGLPDIFTALEQQLGLKLEKTKVTIKMLIVDHVDRMPAEN